MNAGPSQEMWQNEEDEQADLVSLYIAASLATCSSSLCICRDSSCSVYMLTSQVNVGPSQEMWQNEEDEQAD